MGVAHNDGGKVPNLEARAQDERFAAPEIKEENHRQKTKKPLGMINHHQDFCRRNEWKVWKVHLKSVKRRLVLSQIF